MPYGVGKALWHPSPCAASGCSRICLSGRSRTAPVRLSVLWFFPQALPDLVAFRRIIWAEIPHRERHGRVLIGFAPLRHLGVSTGFLQHYHSAATLRESTTVRYRKRATRKFLPYRANWLPPEAGAACIQQPTPYSVNSQEQCRRPAGVLSLELSRRSKLRTLYHSDELWNGQERTPCPTGIFSSWPNRRR